MNVFFSIMYGEAFHSHFVYKEKAGQDISNVSCRLSGKYEQVFIISKNGPLRRNVANIGLRIPALITCQASNVPSVPSIWPTCSEICANNHPLYGMNIHEANIRKRQ